jgi:nicotinamidase-related amidase
MNRADFSDIQILLVEMQPPIIASSATQSAAAIGDAASALMRIADALAIPVTASVVPLGEEAPTLIEELGSISFLVRRTISVLKDQACCNCLANKRRSVIALAGVSSEIAILHTALDARRAGYEVSVLVDCCGGLSSRTETTALEQMRAAGVVVTNLSSFFTGVVGDMGSREGGLVMGALAELWSWNVARGDEVAGPSRRAKQPATSYE